MSSSPRLEKNHKISHLAHTLRSRHATKLTAVAGARAWPGAGPRTAMLRGRRPSAGDAAPGRSAHEAAGVESATGGGKGDEEQK